MKSKKALLILIMLLSVILSKGQECDNYFNTYSDILSKTNDLKEIYKYAFMPEEFIALTRKDTSFLKHYIFNRENYTRTKGEEYYYDMSINFLKNNLRKVTNDNNQSYITKIISSLDTKISPQKPDVNWGKVFETCQTCFFGTYPPDVFTYFNFSLIFMGEKEIKVMINDDDGEQWNYALIAIDGGDSFTLDKNSRYGEDILDRRIASYIIKKWENSDIPEVQELITVFKSVM